MYLHVSVYSPQAYDVVTASCSGDEPCVLLFIALGLW